MTPVVMILAGRGLWKLPRSSESGRFCDGEKHAQKNIKSKKVEKNKNNRHVFFHKCLFSPLWMKMPKPASRTASLLTPCGHQRSKLSFYDLFRAWPLKIGGKFHQFEKTTDMLIFLFILCVYVCACFFLSFQDFSKGSFF